MGSLRSVQVLETELAKERRRLRALTKEVPAVAETFFRFRTAEEQDDLAQKRLFELRKEKKREATKAIADRDAAVKQLKRVKQQISDKEAIKACMHAVKTYTLESLGDGTDNGGGAKGRNQRWEVLDRMARLKAGLSDGQKNDWAWFKDEWDKEMVTVHGGAWASTFASWMQKLLNDDDTAAFSKFMFSETRRVFKDLAALSVPGI